jgi:hypothetical protein
LVRLFADDLGASSVGSEQSWDALRGSLKEFEFEKTTPLSLWVDGAEGLVDKLIKGLMRDCDTTGTMQKWEDHVKKVGKSELQCLADRFGVRYKTKFEDARSLMRMNLFKVFVGMADQAVQHTLTAELYVSITIKSTLLQDPHYVESVRFSKLIESVI